MKKFFLPIFFLGLFTASQAQTSVKHTRKHTKTTHTTTTKMAAPNAVIVNQPAAPVGNLSLKESEYDFGKIPQGKPVTHIFEITNTSSKPFALDNVQASCGCTTPVWNKDVIKPGATSKIEVGFNAANEGGFTKPVTITFNGTETKQIIIKGEVWKTPVTSAPENPANTLKKEQQ